MIMGRWFLFLWLVWEFILLLPLISSVGCVRLNNFVSYSSSYTVLLAVSSFFGDFIDFVWGGGEGGLRCIHGRKVFVAFVVGRALL